MLKEEVLVLLLYYAVVVWYLLIWWILKVVGEAKWWGEKKKRRWGWVRHCTESRGGNVWCKICSRDGKLWYIVDCIRGNDPKEFQAIPAAGWFEAKTEDVLINDTIPQYQRCKMCNKEFVDGISMMGDMMMPKCDDGDGFLLQLSCVDINFIFLR